MNQDIEDWLAIEADAEYKSEPPRIVISLRRSFWHDKNGAYQRTDIRFLKRRTKGFNFFSEDCDNGGAEEVLQRIVNLDACKDGVYQLVMCNTRKDWETGCVEEWDYKLAQIDKATP